MNINKCGNLKKDELEIGSLVNAAWMINVTGIILKINFSDTDCVPKYKIVWFSNLFKQTGNHITEEFYEDIVAIEAVKNWS